ncbi:uncharacterized protein LOC123527433 [Mercenaria mercenaria]|uniref:uncharacterized protein LOC123527433 n=1 Tax=Mercenaria mercenaria TaxID=6596 RepID=UPI00234ED120|nr:uncharacterized protein LOC123527433 [Mercenaria mercenaria]
MTMQTTRGALVVLCFCVVFSSVQQVDSQFDNSMILSIVNGMPIRDKLLFIAQALMDHPAVYQDLEDSLVAALPILEYDKPPERFLGYVLPWALHHLPDLLKNEVFKGAIKIFIEELNAATETPDWYLRSGNATEDRDYYVSHLLSALNYYGMGADILQMKSVTDYFPYNSTDRQLNDQCYKDTMMFFDRLFAGDKWALDMFDAVGKPTTGIRRGVLYFIGTYDQCQKVRAEIPVNATLGQYRAKAEVKYQGRYCRATFTPPRSLIESIAGDHINNTYGVPLTLSVGLCLPDSCHKDDIEGLLNLGILGWLLNITVDRAVCTEEQTFKTDDKSHAVIGILGGLVLLVIVSSSVDFCFLQRKKKHGTLQDIYSPSDLQYHDNNGYVNMPGSGEKTQSETEGKELENLTGNGQISVIADNPVKAEDIKQEIKDPLSKVKLTRAGRNRKKNALSLDISVDSDLTDNILDRSDSSDERVVTKLLRSFSIFTNIPSVLSTETKDDDISCLYGIRVITILWIILGNTYLYIAQSLSEVPVAVDMLDSFDLMERFTMQAVMSAPYATDTFFMISGCLISYWFLYKCEYNNSDVNIKTWLKFYLGKYWKMTPPYMLVMVTFVYLYMYLGQGPLWPEDIAVADSCRTDWWKHLLYVNNLVGVDGVEPEKQCMAWSWYIAVNMQFYLISPIILSFTAFSWSMGLAITGIVAAAGIIAAGVKESQYPGEMLTSRLDGGEYWNNVFIKPWCRVAAYCVGIALGFVIQQWFHKKMNKIIALVLWMLALSVGILLVYIPYTKYVEDLEPWTTTQMAVYEALGRPVWALCVAWVVYACASDLGGPVADFLSWKGFVPLSRLTYLVFLIHPVLMVLDVYTRRTLVHLNDFEMAYQFIGHVVVNFGAAFFASLAFDMPFRNIKRIAHGKSLDTPY